MLDPTIAIPVAPQAAPTWHQRNEKRLVGIHPILAGRVRALLAYMEARQEPELITQGLRTWADQDKLFAQVPKVTRARGGFSQHNYGLAVDLCPDDLSVAGLQLDWNNKHPVWQHLLAAAPQFKLAEGATWRTFPDSPHFYPVELPDTTEELRARYAIGGLASVWTWFESLCVA